MLSNQLLVAKVKESIVQEYARSRKVKKEEPMEMEE